MSDQVPPEMAEADRLTREYVAKVSEYVDAVQVFINKRRDDGQEGSWNMNLGSGNWYARFGHVTDWVDCMRATHSRCSETGEDGSG